MDGAQTLLTHRRDIELAGRGPGVLSALDLGPTERPVDVVFLHANGFNALTYRSILAPLTKDLRILAVDQRGHGATTLTAQAEGRTTWYDLRDDLLALLGTLDLTNVVLGGHSMGGTASLMAAAEAPQRVRSLVLFDPVILPSEAIAARQRGETIDNNLVQGAKRRRAVFPSRQAALDAYRGRGAFRSWSEEMLADYVAGGFRDLPSGEVTLACEPVWEASNFTSHDHDTWSAIRRTTRPIRMLRAEFETTARIEEGMAAMLAAGARIETVPGTTHFLPMERPELVRGALREAAAAG